MPLAALHYDLTRLVNLSSNPLTVHINYIFEKYSDNTYSVFTA